MSYTKNTPWVNGDATRPLDQTRLNHIEDGLFTAAATADNAAAAAEDAQLSANAALTVFTVRDRVVGEDHDGIALNEALSAAAAAGCGVVQFRSARDITLPGGHILPPRTTLDLNGNRVTHTGNNVCIASDPGQTGIGEITGGVINGSIIATGSAQAGASAAAISMSASWGFCLRNVEVYLYENGTGVWARNKLNSWLEGVEFDNVMINACKTGLKMSVEGSTWPAGPSSSLAYWRVVSLAINVPAGGVGIDMVTDNSVGIHLYQGLFNIVFWLRQGSTAWKMSHAAKADRNSYNIVTEVQDGATACTIFTTVSDAQLTGTGRVATISTVETTFHTGSGTVSIASASGDQSFDSRNGSRGGFDIRTALHSDADTVSDYRPRAGWERGTNVERGWFAGYNGGNDVFRVYGIEFGSPAVASWRTYLGVANGRITIGGASGNDVEILKGTGTPEGAVAANVGSLYLRLDGASTTTLYVKTSGAGSTGWTAK